MKICLLVKDFAVGEKFSKNGLPTKSGAEFHAENHALGLIALGNRVTIMAKKRLFRTRARESLASGIDLVRLHEPSRGLELFFRLLTTHRDMDALYIIGKPKFAVWGILAAHLLKKPVTLAVTCHDEIFDCKGWRNRVFASCTNYIGTSHEMAAGYLEKGHLPAERISVLAHGVDTHKFTPATAEQKAAVRAELGIAPETKVVVFCARLVRDKGVDTLLAIWRLVHAKLPEARLLVMGGGLAEWVEALRRLAEETRGSALILGEVDQPQRYYRAGDIYVFPSRHEALPTSLLEAMASGLVPVTSDIGGCDDVVFNGETGYRVPAEDAPAYAEKILTLCADNPARQEMQRAAVALVREKCSYDAVMPQLAKILQSKTAVSCDYLR